MDAKFLSRDFLYTGEYQGVMRNPNYEIDQGFHYHDFYEVQFYFSDAGTMMFENKSHQLHEGDVVFINMFTPHTMSHSPNIQYERFCLSMDPSLLLTASSSDTNLLNLFSNENTNYPVAHLNKTDLKKVLSFLHEYEQCELTYGKDIFQRALIYRILAELYNLFFDGTNLNSSRSRYIPVITTLIRFINEHLSEELSLDLLATQVNFSTYHVCRIFKQFTCLTLSEYIVSKRIEMAKFLLRGNDTISEICQKVGFNNYSYFYKVFKQYTSYAPNEYRKLILSEKSSS